MLLDGTGTGAVGVHARRGGCITSRVSSAVPRKLSTERCGLPCRGRWAAAPAQGGPRPLQITVRRGAVIEDGYAALRNAGEAIKGRLQVPSLRCAFTCLHGRTETALRWCSYLGFCPYNSRRHAQVSFVSSMGTLEAGLDHGGLVKEFLEEARAGILPHSGPVCIRETSYVYQILPGWLHIGTVTTQGG